MALVELIMPKMGESIMEATILTWLKKPGDKIDQDESVLEVATDKVDTEVPSTHAGILKEILAKEGEVVKVGKAIAIISSDTIVANPIEKTPVTPASEKTEVKRTPEVAVLSNGNGSHVVISNKNTSRFYSPLVKNIAKEENIAVAKLETVPGTGAEGRVTKKDILAYIQHRKLGHSIAQVRPSAPLVPA